MTASITKKPRQMTEITVKPQSTVKLLGATLDQHLTFAPHNMT